MRPEELHFVVPGPLDQLTGGYVYDARMVAGLRKLRWQVHVHSLRGRFPDPDALARDDLASALASLPDGARVVIDGLAMGGLPAPIEAQGDRLRILSLVHHPLAEETGLSAADKRRFSDTERRALEPCAGALVSSAFTARHLKAYDVPADRIRVIVPGTERARSAVGPLQGRPPLLLCVASVTPRKGHDVLVAALARVRDLDWTCVCAGSVDRDRAFSDSVLRDVADAGLSDRIAFVGEKEGDLLEELYHRTSVFALASHYEGYGMALAEAIAHGLPVVSTTGGAIPFTVPADCGILVEPGDAAAFADALRTVLTPGTKTREDLAAAARRRAEALPTWRQAVEAFAVAVIELTP